MLDFFKGTVTLRDWAFCGVVLAIAITLAAGFYLVVHPWQLKKEQTLLADTNTQEAKIAAAKKYEATVKADTTTAEKIQEIVDTFEGRLPPDWKVNDILKRFEETGKEVFEVSKPRLEPKDPFLTGNRETLPLIVKTPAAGTFRKILEFMNRLELEDRYFSVSEFDIKADPKGQGQAEAQLTLNTFRFIQMDTAKAAVNPGKEGGKAPGGSTSKSAPAPVK